MWIILCTLFICLPRNQILTVKFFCWEKRNASPGQIFTDRLPLLWDMNLKISQKESFPLKKNPGLNVWSRSAYQEPFNGFCRSFPIGSNWQRFALMKRFCDMTQSLLHQRKKKSRFPFRLRWGCFIRVLTNSLIKKQRKFWDTIPLYLF